MSSTRRCAVCRSRIIARRLTTLTKYCSTDCRRAAELDRLHVKREAARAKRPSFAFEQWPGGEPAVLEPWNAKPFDWATRKP